jgi:hypothetical protein
MCIEIYKTIKIVNILQNNVIFGHTKLITQIEIFIYIKP